MSLVQQLSDSELAIYVSAWPGGDPTVEYVSLTLPYRSYRWTGARLALSASSFSYTSAEFAALSSAVRISLRGAAIIDQASPYSVLGVVDGQGDLSSLGGASAPVTITGSNALTRSANFNRQNIIADAGNTTQTLNNDATNGAAAGDYFELDNKGAGTVTLAGGTGTLVAGTGFSATVPPNTVGVFTYVGANTWLSATPAASGSAAVAVYGITGAISAITPGGGSNQVSARISLPANAIPITGWAVLSVTWVRTGNTDVSFAMSSRIGAAGVSHAAATVLTSHSISQATNVRMNSQVWIKGNRTDRTTILYENTSSTEVVTARFLSAASVTLSLSTAAAIDIVMGGNAGATDSYQVLDAMVTVYTPS